MEEFDVYNDIKQRTGGDIYIGVVGPVRTGKSTFITRFMDKLVMPYAQGFERDRMRDELPQSAEGRTIMTTQPRFVPSEAVTINVAENVPVNVRLVDCVGYLVDGVNGHMEDGHERMVQTPWFNEPIAFERAAEIGTEKVICDHSTIGVVMTTDGSITTDLGRSPYVQAEERAVRELKALNKPFVIVLNSRVPDSPETVKLANELSAKYENAVVPLNVLEMEQADIIKLFERILLEFPVRDIEVKTAKWLQALDQDNPIITELMKKCTQFGASVSKMNDVLNADSIVDDSEFFDSVTVDEVLLGEGRATYTVNAKSDLFYKALSAECGVDINDEFELIASLSGLVSAKKQFDKLSGALTEVAERGYGVVTPTLEEMTLEEPEIVRRGSGFGVRLKASAPSLHIMRVDIETEVCPVVGTQQQSEDLVEYMLSEFEQDPKSIWETNMFGKPLSAMVNEEINNKLTTMPADAQKKMRRTLSRIVNEGKGGVICILL